MPDRPVSSPSAFTASEREFIRLELGQHFSSFPSVADGLMLRVWRTGPQAGQPKLPKPVQTMLARGLVEIRTDRFPRAFLTEAGLAALRQMAADRRALDPIRYAHVLRELGLPAASRSRDRAIQRGSWLGSDMAIWVEAYRPA